jgi:hypothetical protein
MNPEMWEYALADGVSGRFIFRLSWNSENRARLAAANQRVTRRALRRDAPNYWISSGQA